MEIVTSDGKRFFDAGSAEDWKSLHSTVRVLLSDYKENIPLVFDFFEKGRCEGAVAQETARQFNLVRDALSKFAPKEAVYDYESPQDPIPWIDSISPIVTSCANLYTTAEGQDLLFELVSILTYASIKKVSVEAESA